jgi:Tfp pilus assembly protein PilN
MIRINLVPGPQKRRGGSGAKLPNFGELFATVKDPLLLGVVAAWVVGVLVVGLLYVTGSSAYNSAEQQQRQLQAEALQLHALIAKKHQAESLRDSLVAELAQIREIDADRYVWPHILDEVTHALPDYTWLVGLSFLPPTASDLADSTKVPPIRFTIDGRTSDISAYTRFVRQLANSPWLTDVVFGAANAVVADGRQVTAFTVTATFREADSAYIRTVPITASVR